jgi:nucleoredoxin
MKAKKLKTKLSKKFKVQGIPSFVILDGATGEVITLEGREAVSNDPKGEELPWHPVPLKELLYGTEFLKGSAEADKDKKVTFNDDFLKGKEAIGLYFSAHWCPPCKRFTPMFGECYKKINKDLEGDKKKFEVMYLSCDRSEEQFNEYFGTMPWMAMPFTDRKKNQQLSGHFDVSGIPALVILNVVANKDGSGYELEVANKNAVGNVSGDEAGEKFPWLPEPVKELDEDPEGIDEGLSLICLFEAIGEKGAEGKAKVDEVKNILKEASKKRQKIGDNEDALNFFCASKSGRLADRVRSECKVGEKKDGKVEVVMMDIGAEEYYAFPADKEFSADTLEEFFESYERDLLKAAPMGA